MVAILNLVFGLEASTVFSEQRSGSGSDARLFHTLSSPVRYQYLVFLGGSNVLDILPLFA